MTRPKRILLAATLAGMACSVPQEPTSPAPPPTLQPFTVRFEAVSGDFDGAMIIEVRGGPLTAPIPGRKSFFFFSMDSALARFVIVGKQLGGPLVSFDGPAANTYSAAILSVTGTDGQVSTTSDGHL